MDTRDFNKLRTNIEESKVKINQAEGVKNQLYSTLKDTYGFDTIEQAQAEIEKIKKDISIDEEKKASILKELDSLIDWRRL